MKSKWLRYAVAIDGHREFSEELGELTPEEATAKSDVLLRKWCANHEVHQCWLFYEKEGTTGSGTMLWERPRKTV
jgi:hypothetical protein